VTLSLSDKQIMA